MKDERAPPPLPKQLWSPLGPIKVRVIKRIKPLSKEVPTDIDDFGQYDPAKRTIRIAKNLDPWVQWQTLRHEWVHAVVFDQGFHQAFTEDQIEAICDLIGTALVAEMRYSRP